MPLDESNKLSGTEIELLLSGSKFEGKRFWGAGFTVPPDQGSEQYQILDQTGYLKIVSIGRCNKITVIQYMAIGGMNLMILGQTPGPAERMLDEPDNPTDYSKHYLSTCILCNALFEQSMGNTKQIYPHIGQ